MTKEKPLEKLIDSYSYTAIFRTVAFIGDSLSSGEFEAIDSDGNVSYHDLYEYSWGQHIARKNGLSGYNFSRGGMTAKWYLESFAQENGFWDKEKAAQAYVIALGFNEIYCQNSKIGDTADITKTSFSEERPFISYYAEIVKKYKEISPDAKFFFVTFPNDNARKGKEKTEEMVQALYALAEHFENSYVIDLYQYGPIFDDKFINDYFLHGHMNPMGYIYVAKLIDSYIDYIIRTNPNDFKNVPFICTNVRYK